MTEKIETKVQDMGESTSHVFAGEGQYEASKMMYAESPDYFTNIIRNNLPPSNKPYKLLDLGSYKGELLGKILERTRGDYKFDTIAIDVNKKALDENVVADEKIVASLNKLPLPDHSADIAIMRLVLQWNTPEKQKEILMELARVVSKFGIVQHVGPDVENPELWREKIDYFLGGEVIPRIKRVNHYYSSRDEVEQWMKEMQIDFQRLQDRKIEHGTDVFIERYKLNEEETGKMRESLLDKDYLMQTTWVVSPSK